MSHSIQISNYNKLFSAWSQQKDLLRVTMPIYYSEHHLQGCGLLQSAICKEKAKTRTKYPGLSTQEQDNCYVAPTRAHLRFSVWPLHSLDACLFLGALMVDHWYSPSPFWLTLSQALLFCVSLAVHPCFCVLWHPHSVAASPQTMAMGEVSVPFWCVNIFPAQVCSENRLLLNLIALPV